MYVVDTAPEIYKAFLLGYAYACGKRFSATLDENDRHDDEGKFAPKGTGHVSTAKSDSEENNGSSSSISQPEDISELIGKDLGNYKGSEAIEKLMLEKHGHIKGAFNNPKIGDIDLMWGDGSFGLSHIIKRRSEQGIDVDRFLNALPGVINNGEAELSQKTGRWEINKGREWVIVSPVLRGNKLDYVLTAYHGRARKKKSSS